MKYAIASLVLILFISCVQEKKQEENPEPKEVETVEKQKLLRHVVLFKYKDESSAEDIAMINQKFIELQDSIPQIVDFEWGTNNSPENINDGFTHCYFLTFASEEDRDTYLPHPAHKAFGESLRPHLDKVLVVDYWVE